MRQSKSHNLRNRPQLRNTSKTRKRHVRKRSKTDELSDHVVIDDIFSPLHNATRLSDDNDSSDDSELSSWGSSSAQKRRKPRQSVSAEIQQEATVEEVQANNQNESSSLSSNTLTKEQNGDSWRRSTRLLHRAEDTSPEKQTDSKNIVNEANYTRMTDEQKARLHRLIPSIDLVPVGTSSQGTLDLGATVMELEKSCKDYDNSVQTKVEHMGTSDSNDQKPAPSVMEEAKPININENDASTTPPHQPTIKHVLRPYFFHDVIYKECVTEFQEQLYNGECTEEYKATVRKAREDYLNSDVVEPWKDLEFEKQWGDLSFDPRTQIAGDSASIALTDMALAKLIRENDILFYERCFNKVDVKVVSRVRVISINKRSGALTVVDEKDPALVFDDIVKPTALETQIIDEDGRVPKDRRPNGNAFRSIKLIRNGKNLGSLFHIRKEYFYKAIGGQKD
ncbi:2114_t:CDS:2 [Paraglomus brasilianum]|uniref:2114_t:CDS:1 n=1 Tax=Paraglomus brasilianum TaxID=144538 RepID=A0A9N9AN47_9GLOM|nr:2114_t:CDS:2 [Paraglomus brasilianum]